MMAQEERVEGKAMEWLGTGLYSLAPDGVWRHERVQFIYPKRHYVRLASEFGSDMVIVNLEALIAATFTRIGLPVCNSNGNLTAFQVSELYHLAKRCGMLVNVERVVVPRHFWQKPLVSYTLSAMFLDWTAPGAYR